jgi:isochorismate synthase
MGAFRAIAEQIKNKFFYNGFMGTQAFLDTEDVRWESKEKEEQQIVTDFILEKLENLS